ncbi:MAG TPA: hypothetical protein VFP38_13825, partial [Bradyrhizobium sp.]|nr:hypothetical protein [Bradyrhizobium sp.]
LTPKLKPLCPGLLILKAICPPPRLRYLGMFPRARQYRGTRLTSLENRGVFCGFWHWAREFDRIFREPEIAKKQKGRRDRRPSAIRN